MKKMVKYLATIGMVAILIFSSVNLVSADDNRTEKIEFNTCVDTKLQLLA